VSSWCDDVIRFQSVAAVVVWRLGVKKGRKHSSGAKNGPWFSLGGMPVPFVPLRLA